MDSKVIDISSQRIVVQQFFLGERRATIPLPEDPQSSALPIELLSPYKNHRDGASTIICHSLVCI